MCCMEHDYILTVRLHQVWVRCQVDKTERKCQGDKYKRFLSVVGVKWRKMLVTWCECGLYILNHICYGHNKKETLMSAYPRHRGQSVVGDKTRPAEVKSGRGGCNIGRDMTL